MTNWKPGDDALLEGEHVWVIRLDLDGDGEPGAWVIRPPATAMDYPTNPEWAELESLQPIVASMKTCNAVTKEEPTPVIDPAAYDKPALKSMAQAVIDLLGGQKGAASKLSWNHYLTLTVCASFITERKVKKARPKKKATKKKRAKKARSR